jgi:hypothetical protein
MSRICVCPSGLLSSSCFLLLFVALSSPLLSQVTPASGASAAGSASSATTIQSDAAATQAIQNVLVQSGGASAWSDVRSAEESFSVLKAGEKEPQVIRLLDDWSSDTTRYRRKTRGQSTLPVDHNGSSTFSSNIGNTPVAVNEFDQARALVGRLPAAAAEVMLRRSEYVLKITVSRPCESGNICVDVFRKGNYMQSLPPDQQWKITKATGLPATVRYRISSIGNSSIPIWQEVYFLQYATEEGLVVPVSIGMSLGGKRQTWTFVSLHKNPGFDISKFDQEAAQ